MIVDAKHPPKNYFVVPALAPHYVVSDNTLTQQLKNGQLVFDHVSVALLAIHVVFNAVRDNAPAAPDNPSDAQSAENPEISPDDFPLYKAHTRLNDANTPRDLPSIVPFWDEASQSFSKGGKIIQTSVYRPYPGSKTNGSPANPDHKEDSEVFAMNVNATAMFKKAESEAKAKNPHAATDARQYYRLVGAIWLDQPAAGAHPTFVKDARFSIDEKQSTDDAGQALAGEGRLGSTAMESFTESKDQSPNCFSCHDTRSIINGAHTINAARLNVSHLLSKALASPTLNPLPVPAPAHASAPTPK
jgi:hypothetical protein